VKWQETAGIPNAREIPGEETTISLPRQPLSPPADPQANGRVR
jgi:hypothetical protein